MPHRKPKSVRLFTESILALARNGVLPGHVNLLCPGGASLDIDVGGEVGGSCVPECETVNDGVTGITECQEVVSRIVESVAVDMMREDRSRAATDMAGREVNQFAVVLAQMGIFINAVPIACL